MKLNFLVEGFVSIWERGRKHLPRTIGFIEGVVVLAIALFLSGCSCLDSITF
jgi:hypothetical protein